MRPTGVLLDVDGTLIDSNDSHAHAWVDALCEAGVVVEFSAVRRSICIGGDNSNNRAIRSAFYGPRGQQFD